VTSCMQFARLVANRDVSLYLVVQCLPSANCLTLILSGHGEVRV